MQYENALALRTSLETGWRIDDVLHLRVSDLKGRTLSCISMKTGKPDKKVISADLAKRLLQVANNGRLFDGRFGDKPRTRQAVWRDVKKAVKRLGIAGNVAPHSARKTYAVEDFKDNGLAQVQKDLQHDRLSTTLIYAFADLLTSSEGIRGGAFLRAEKNDVPEKTDDGQKQNAAEIATGAKTGRAQGAAPLNAHSQTAMAFAEYVAEKVLERIEPLILRLTNAAR